MDNQNVIYPGIEDIKEYNDSNEVENPIGTKPYAFRKLNSTDLFSMIKIISKIGINELTQVFEGDVIKSLVSQAKEEGNKEENKEENEGQTQFVVGVGIALKMANKILEHIPSCEREIYSLLANVSCMDVEQIKGLDLEVFLEMLIDFVMKEEFKSFFKVASKYIKA